MDTDRFIKDLAKKYNKDERVIRSIVNSPFLFTKRMMMSLDDERPIRIPRIGTFTLRYGKGKYIAHLRMINKFIKKLMVLYFKADTPLELKQGILFSVNTMIEQLKKEGYENEQSVQHIIKWKNRVEAGDFSNTTIQSDMGEGQVED